MKPTLVIFAVLLLGMGCARRLPRPAAEAPPPVGSATEPVIAPAPSEPGRVLQVNAKYRFVVVDFGRRAPPPPGSRLIGYRHGQPVATFRLTESSRGRFGVADILEGDPRVGDEIQLP